MCLPQNPRYVVGTEITMILTPRRVDDRFIAKELSRVELQSMETFAPAYFDYLSSAVSANVRSLPYHLVHLLTAE